MGRSSSISFFDGVQASYRAQPATFIYTKDLGSIQG
jgi:hypothetical protein